MSIIIIGRWEVRQDYLKTFLTLIPELTEQTLQEKGVINYQILQSVKDPTHFVLFEEYISHNDIAKHMDSFHYRQIITKQIHPYLSYRQGDIYEHL